jgi:hypothetical protein
MFISIIKRLNEQYLAKINELMKERENSINSSNISGTNSSVKQIESISDERKLHVSDPLYYFYWIINYLAIFAYASISALKTIFFSFLAPRFQENSKKHKETQASLQRMSENFNCLRSLCLQDLTMRDADPKRLLAEAARQLAVIESDPMAL